MEVSSFSSRRPAAGALPAFTLPPPNADVPRSTADGISPGLSSVHTTSSQASQSNMQYTYQQNSQQGWGNSSASPYGAQSHHSQPPSHQSQQSAFGPRTTGMYSQTPMTFPTQRSSQSPATGAEGLPAPPMDHSSYQVSSHDAHSSMTSAAPSHGSIMPPTQPQTPSSGGQMEYSYTSRGPSNANYYTASPAHQQGAFPTYGAQQSPPLPSPTSAHDSRGLPGQPMGSYRYPGYHQVGMGGGPVMSNIHQPGGQMSMIPGMGVSQNYGGQHMMYSHHGHQPAPQSERPFKCDQCVQSFSRNHDLKRHKRIHLAVKPFPCNFCSKSFSRKDALKRHRLVKGCENKTDGGNADESQDRNGGPSSATAGSEQAPRPAM